MQAIINPGNIHGTIIAPPSKSMTQRAYAAALLHTGTSIIHNPGNSDDEQAAFQVVQQLGITNVLHMQNALHLTGNGSIAPDCDYINCGESGLATRLFTPIAALSRQSIRVDGRGSLLQRLMEGFREALPVLGVELKEFNGHIPFFVQGPMKAKSLTIDASGSSQFLSGLLFALSSCATTPVTISVSALKSKPYIDMTLMILEQFGKIITHNGYKTFYIDPAKFIQKETVEVEIEADWSSAAYFLVAGSVAGSITVQNLDINTSQADKAILDVLRAAGALVNITGNNISVKKSSLKSFEFDATDTPDLFPVLAILAACCDGESYIKGVHRLFHKESNRAESIAEMLQNFDIPFSLEDDSFCITGIRKLQGTVIDSYNDHRIVMAASIAALRAGSRVDINGAEAIKKSYPSFFEDLILCGGKCILT